MTPRYLYHWTPAVNLESIAVGGLDPSYATGRRKVVWAAAESRALWAVSHAAMHQHCSPDEMACIRVRVNGLISARSAWQGVETFAGVIPPWRLVVVEVMFSRTGRPVRQWRKR